MSPATSPVADVGKLAAFKTPFPFTINKFEVSALFRIRKTKSVDSAPCAFTSSLAAGDVVPIPTLFVPSVILKTSAPHRFLYIFDQILSAKYPKP